jgi:rhodanese-related sulfurtransferase
MRKLALVLWVCSLAVPGCSSQTLSTAVAPSVETLSAEDLKQWADAGREFVFLDVREASEIENLGTLKNCKHIPLGELEARLAEVPKGVPIVTACNRGVRAGRAAALLQKHGYTGVKSTGLAEYRARGYALVYPQLNHRPRTATGN